MQALGCGVCPAQLAARIGLADSQTQLPRRVFGCTGQSLPVREATGQLQTRRQHIAGEIKQLPGGQILAEKLHAGFIELVGLVKNGDTYCRQQLRHAGFAYRHVRKKQVVIDHHDVSRQRLPARVVDMAGTELGAWRAQAVLAGGSHPRNNRGAFVQSRKFCQIAADGRARPLFNFAQGTKCAALRKAGVVASHLHPVQTKIAAPPFKQCCADWQLQGLDQRRQIAAKKLVLQRLGGGGK